MKHQVLKNILTFAFLFSMTQASNAQNWSWGASGQCVRGIGTGVSVDGIGNVYMTGWFDSPSLAFGSYSLTNSGTNKSFLVKYNANGNVIWLRSSNASAADENAISVTTDNNNNVYMAGEFGSATLSFGTFTLTKMGIANGFLVKFDANGNVLWAKSSIATSANPYKITTDPQGNIFIAGNYNGSSIVFDTFTLTSTGPQNTFIAKYDASGNVLWAKNSIGTNFDNGFSVSTDALGSAYLSGYISGSTISFGSFTLTNTMNNGGFLTKYDANGNEVWARSPAMPAGYNQGYSVCSDPAGNSYLTGPYGGPIVFGTYTLTGGGAYLVKYDTNGNVVWAINAGGISNAVGHSVSTDGNNIYLSGGFNSPLTFGTFSLTPPPGASFPLFMARYDLNGNVIYATSLAGGGDYQHNNSCVDNLCNMYVTGDFRGSPTNLVVGSNTLTQTGTMNPFVAKYAFNCLATAIHNNPGQKNGITIFPNPNNGSFKFEIDHDIKQGEFILINAIGQEVYQQKISGGTTQIDTPGLPVGLYNYIINQDKKAEYRGKLVIE